MPSNQFDGNTAWGQSLVKMQEEFEARMQSRKEAVTPWAKDLMQLQASLEARMQARSQRRAKRGSATTRARDLMKEWDAKLIKRQRRSMTTWGQSLVNLQQEFETRMQSRSKARSENVATTPFVQSLVQSQKYFEDWNSAIMSERRARSALTPWAKDLVQLQASMQSRTEKRSEEAPMTPW